jgi:hypothetical protein
MAEQFFIALNIFLDAIKNWWWVFPPIILWRPFLSLWLYWRQEKFISEQKQIMLEIKLPRDILKPIKAMDQVFASLWGDIYDPPDWWEKWIEGKVQMGYTFDIVSLGGETHFYIRCPAAIRNSVESSIYSQYSEAEISLAEDYTKNIPQDVPNKEWDIWGANYQLIKDDVYPIRTYAKFFEERPEAAKEEKRMDPIASLLEGLGRLGEGEQFWIQFGATPTTIAENDYIGRGKKIVDKMLKRKEPKKPKSMVEEAAEGLVWGKVGEDKEEERIFYPEMQLSPGEKEIVSGIENKIGQYAFESYIRFIYIGKKEVFFKPQSKAVFGYFSQFSTTNLNAMKPWPVTITKIHKSWFLPLNLLIPRRLYVKQRRLFREYIKRLPPFFPDMTKSIIFSTEELASIFHFPGRITAPAISVSRIESRRGGAPRTLPMEE